MDTTLDVSRLLKHIPVYGFYGYWRIKEKYYAIASAGTIVEPNATDDATNMNTATESVCPKGWTLPTTKQIDANRDAASFSSILGGNYYDGTLASEDTRGSWWSSTAYNGARRYLLNYNGSDLYTGNGARRNGFYIRCVSEEKTVTDLTYLQDMTGEIANKAAGFFISLSRIL
ncbi:hypothetical protein IJI18_03040 [Candidatus Saccharibacteria bacterium]|nr:hypothetical protein [Candidatus Saccharibacteria bacterium]